MRRALPTETKVESGTSQSKSGTSVNLSNSGKPDGVGAVVRLRRSPRALGSHLEGGRKAEREVGREFVCVREIERERYSRLH